MKSIKYIILGMLVLILLLPAFTYMQKQQKVNTLVFQAVDAKATISQLNAAKEIFSLRLKSLTLKNFQLFEKSDARQIILSVTERADLEKAKDILLAVGKVNFYPVIIRQQVLRTIENQMELICTRQIHDLMHLSDSASFRSDYLLGQSTSNDTSAINSCLGTVAMKGLLPANLRLLWSKYIDKAGRLDLFAVNAADNDISERSISEAKALDSNQGSTGISLTFREDMWATWKELTHNNINKTLAIVIDGHVYSAPMVRNEIASGKVVITGNFSVDEVNKLVAVISHGPLPVQFEIVEMP